jgi:hypothetical protein
MMSTQKSDTNWELALVLPLGSVAHHLGRLEEQLRVAGMRALDLGRENGGREVRVAVQLKLERIREAMGSITSLVEDIEDDMQPDSRHSVRKPHPAIDD